MNAAGLNQTKRRPLLVVATQVVEVSLNLDLDVLFTSLGRLLIWGPLCLVGWRRPLARLEVIYNGRTVLVSLWRDDMFDAELMRIG
ncbi:MAG TPA: hypothetical protein EYP77_04320 [Anaerolineae bacterium]|nr:hypothetical protein [Anaerolineae bacterium]